MESSREEVSRGHPTSHSAFYVCFVLGLNFAALVHWNRSPPYNFASVEPVRSSVNSVLVAVNTMLFYATSSRSLPRLFCARRCLSLNPSQWPALHAATLFPHTVSPISRAFPWALCWLPTRYFLPLRHALAVVRHCLADLRHDLKACLQFFKAKIEFFKACLRF